MGKYGKWIGGGLGFVLGGPIGVVLGFAIGSMFDHATMQPIQGFESTGNTSGVSSGDFSVSLLVLCAAIMRADGKVVVGELDFVKEFFKQHYGADRTRQYMSMLREMLKQDFSVRQVCLQIRQHIDHASRLQLLHLLYGVANADGSIDNRELEEIERIAAYLGISEGDSHSLRAMYYQNNRHAYDILEITKEASDEEVKKAYRKLAVKHHPDKVAHLGEEIQKSAKEKFQKIQDAYEKIKKERAIN
jgi:DnaJ like chaperone protein